MVTNKMSMPSRLEYLKKVKKRYLKSDKENKQKILDELCTNTGYNRKYAIRRLSAKVSLSEKSRVGRKVKKCVYTNEDIYWLAKVWEALDYPCGQRMQPMLSEMIDTLIKFKELKIPDSIAGKLKKISSASIDNKLKPHRRKLRKKINGTTKPGSLIKK